MSAQQEQLPAPPPPVFVMNQEANAASTGHGSVGPVIAVLAVIAILGVLAGMVGRLCTGRSVMGFGHFDVEGWIETKCAACLDGHVEPPRPRSVAAGPATVTVVPRQENSGRGGRSAEPVVVAAAAGTARAEEEEDREEEEDEGCEWDGDGHDGDGKHNSHPHHGMGS